jgi:hypothetical protein
MKKVINNAGVDRTHALWQYVTGQGIPAWNSATAYLPGDTVVSSSSSETLGWVCIVGNTDQAPSVGSAYWNVYDAVGTGIRDMVIKDFYFLGPPVFYPNPLGDPSVANYGAYPIVDGDYPISYQPYQAIPNQGYVPKITFQPFSIVKDKLSYKTGFEASTLSLTIRPRDPNPLTQVLPTVGVTLQRGIEGAGENSSYAMGQQNNPPYSDSYAAVNEVGEDGAVYQTMRQSFAQTTDWYLAPVTMFRGFSPAGQEGDLDTFGAAVMFRGRLSELTVDREDVKLSVSSLMQIFKQKVPSQTIQPGNRWAPFDFNPTFDFFGQTEPTTNGGGYNWINTNIGAATGFTDGALAEGWALIGNGSGHWWRKIYTNVNTYTDTNPSSPTYEDVFTTVIFIENLPISLSLPDSGSLIQIQLWEAFDTAANPSGPGAGFPYVPQPMTGIT